MWLRKWKQEVSGGVCGPAGTLWLPASPTRSRSFTAALIQLGREGVPGRSTAGQLAWAHRRASPAPPHRDHCSGHVPSVLHPPAPYSCSFESPAWEAVDVSLCSLFRPLSSRWRQPCSSLGCLINSIINAERQDSPRAFLIATHAWEYAPQADRKQGLVPGAAPSHLQGPSLANAQLDHSAPPPLGQPWKAHDGRVREAIAGSEPHVQVLN